jgi:hypothetical protein
MPFASMAALGLKDDEIGTMLRQARRYHVASLQDANPAIAFLHNAYSVGIMDMLRDMATDDEIRAATDVDARALRKEILKVQDDLEGKTMKVIESIGLDKAMRLMREAVETGI